MRNFFSSCLVLLVILCCSCNKQPTYSSIAGEWQVTDVEIDVKKSNQKISNVILERSMEVALNTTYTFSMDSTYIVTHYQNETSEITYRFVGKYRFDVPMNGLILTPEQMEVLKDGAEWEKAVNSMVDTLSEEKFVITTLTGNKINIAQQGGTGILILQTWKRKKTKI